MVEDPDIHPPSNDQSDVDRFAALADESVTALGLSSSAADALEQALEVKTVRDLADNRYVRRAQAIVNLANEQKQRFPRQVRPGHGHRPAPPAHLGDP
jgi:hypothetical protein